MFCKKTSFAGARVEKTVSCSVVVIVIVVVPSNDSRVINEGTRRTERKTRDKTHACIRTGRLTVINSNCQAVDHNLLRFLHTSAIKRRHERTNSKEREFSRIDKQHIHQLVIFNRDRLTVPNSHYHTRMRTKISSPSHTTHEWDLACKRTSFFVLFIPSLHLKHVSIMEHEEPFFADWLPTLYCTAREKRDCCRLLGV